MPHGVRFRGGKEKLIREIFLVRPGKKHGELHDEVERLLIATERQRINDLFRSGKLNDEARRRIERELDFREANLPSRDHRAGIFSAGRHG